MGTSCGSQDVMEIITLHIPGANLCLKKKKNVARGGGVSKRLTASPFLFQPRGPLLPQGKCILGPDAFAVLAGWLGDRGSSSLAPRFPSLL